MIKYETIRKNKTLSQVLVEGNEQEIPTEKSSEDK